MGRFARALSVVVIVASSLSTSSLRAALLTNLGQLDGNNRSAATDINDAGVVVGTSFTVPDSPPGPTPINQRAFRYSGAGPMEPLTPVGTTSFGVAINNAGTIVGQSAVAGGGYPFHWTAPGPVQNLPIAGEANGINDSGVIVGRLGQFGYPQHAFRYVVGNGGEQEDLGVIAGTQSYAHDINEAGVIVGWSNINATAVKKAARYANGAWSAIPGISNLTDSEALSINESGDVVGSVGTSAGFRFNSATGTTVGLAGIATDINDAGFVVGTVNGRAALWRPDNTFVDLDAWLDTVAPAEGANMTLLRANAINNHGLIVGYMGTGGQGAFLLDASALVPEPAAISLILPAATAALRRRRRPRRR